VVNLIKTDDLTPQDRARMKDEYSQEEAFKKAKEEGLQLGEARGLEKGREEGIEQGKLEIAKNMLAQGLAIELIEQVTGIHSSLFKS